MSQVAASSTELNTLWEEHKAYVGDLKATWLVQNRMNSRNVLEVMPPQERAEVHRRIAEWARYITPLAEAWWKERGYRVVWPDDNSKSMQVFKL